MTGKVSSRPEASGEVTPAQAELLLDPQHYTLLQLLMRGEPSASELARELGVPLSRAHYLLGKFVAAGLARVAREEKRAGRAVKRYQSVRPEWFVPFEVTSATTLTELFTAQLEPRMAQVYALLARQALRGGARQGVTLRVQDGVLQVQLRSGAPENRDETRTTTGQVSGLRLSAERARDFRARLEALAAEFQTTPNDEGETFTLGLFFVQGELPN